MGREIKDEDFLLFQSLSLKEEGKKIEDEKKIKGKKREKGKMGIKCKI